MKASQREPALQSRQWWRRRCLETVSAVCVASASQTAMAADGGGFGGHPLTFVVILGALALLPFLLIMVTSFVKVAVVLSILRKAIGTQQIPPNQVITGLAIILSLYIMAPVGIDIYQRIQPELERLQSAEATVDVGSIQEIGGGIAEPMREFLTTHADVAEQQLLVELAVQLREPAEADAVGRDDLLVAVPAFVVTELKEAFTIGCILFVPFIIVDLVVANILLSLGMHMLSPTTVSLPFKLLLFVLVDGWFLVVKGLVLGYATV